jgi:hypothetical protein
MDDDLYVPERTLFKLDFSQTEYPGLRAVTQSADFGLYLAILAVAEEAETAGPKEALDVLGRLFGLFENVLVSWNLGRVDKETGERVPVPPTKDGMLTQDPALVMAVIQMATREMTQAPPDLGKESGSGATSEETPPGLAEASASLPSSSAQRL